MGLREALALLYIIYLIIIIVGESATATAVTTNSNINITQNIQKIPPPPSNIFQTILQYIANAYNYVVGFIQNILQSTLLKQDPGLATTYANIIAWLIPLTAIYVIFSIIEVAKKILGYIIAAGWIFLLAMMFLAH